MASVAIKRTGRSALCYECGLPIFEGTAWSEEPQWFHEREPRHAINPVYISDGTSVPTVRVLSHSNGGNEPSATALQGQPTPVTESQE